MATSSAAHFLFFLSFNALSQLVQPQAFIWVLIRKGRLDTFQFGLDQLLSQLRNHCHSSNHYQRNLFFGARLHLIVSVISIISKPTPIIGFLLSQFICPRNKTYQFLCTIELFGGTCIYHFFISNPKGTGTCFVKFSNRLYLPTCKKLWHGLINFFIEFETRTEDFS